MIRASPDLSCPRLAGPLSGQRARQPPLLMEPFVMINSFSGAGGGTGRPHASCGWCGRGPAAVLAPIGRDGGRDGCRAEYPAWCLAAAGDRVHNSTRELVAASGFTASALESRVGARPWPLSAKTLHRLKQSLARYPRIPGPANQGGWGHPAAPGHSGRPANPCVIDRRAATRAQHTEMLSATVSGPSPTYAGLLPEHARAQTAPSLAAGPDGDAQPNLLWLSPPMPAQWSTTATPGARSTVEPASTPGEPAPDLTGDEIHWAIPYMPGGVDEPEMPVMRWAPNHWALASSRDGHNAC